MPDLLFLYGTLHPDRAPAEIAHAARRLIHAGSAEIRGRRYDLGPYPGVILDDSGAVAGELFALPDAATLAELDAYEEYLPELPAASLFLRVQTVATLADGTQLRCWVYVYNRQLPGNRI